MPKARQSIYPTQRKTHFWIVFAAAVLGVLVVFVTLWAARKSLCSGDVFHLYVTIAVWAIAPPVWFWFEYFTVYLRWGKPESFDLFKYGQQVAAAIWAGVLATLLAFAASGALDPEKSVLTPERCKSLCGAESQCEKPPKAK
jgi:uncharacterized membrane protein